MNTITSKEALCEELLLLQLTMERVASKMSYYAGFNAEINAKAAELFGASVVISDWIKVIQGEDNE